jgi:hypothetical protein
MTLREQLANESANIASRISQPGGDRIRYSKQNQLVLPDGSEVDELEVVVLDFISSNVFYDRDYDPKNPIPPACFAIGANPAELVPSKNSPAVQSTTCKACPNNQFGSKGNGKACKNTRLLAVIPYDGLVDGESDIWIQSIPPTSVKSFDAYVQLLSVRHKSVPIGVRTMLSMEPKADYASPRFKVLGLLDDELLEKANQLRSSAQTRLLTEPDVSAYQSPKSKAAPRGAVRR